MKELQDNPCQAGTSAPCESACEPKLEHFSLWGLSYHIVDYSGTEYSGTALVRARDAKHAEHVFKTNSAFNGMQNLLKIDAIAQVPDLTESGLCIEAYTDGSCRIINYGS